MVLTGDLKPIRFFSHHLQPVRLVTLGSILDVFQPQGKARRKKKEKRDTKNHIPKGRNQEEVLIPHIRNCR